MRLLFPRVRNLLPHFLVLVILSYWSDNSLAQGALPDVRRDANRIGVSFETEDGWTIRGTLVLPPNATRLPVPGVVLLTEPVNRLRTTYSSTLEAMLPKEGIAVLIIDMRGTSGSYAREEGQRDFLKFTPAELDGLQLDIKAAIKFLASQKIVDGNRIGIVGSGLTANYAIIEAYENPAVQMVVSISTTQLSEKARKYLTCNLYCLNYERQKKLPVLTIVGADQEKSNQRIEAEPWNLSEHDNSKLFFGIQRGTNMLNRPTGIREETTKWIVDNLKALPMETPFSFKASDGWNLHGTLFMPGIIQAGTDVPAVVLVHGINHSEESMYDLAREMAKGGIASFTFDWRGTRKSADEEKGEVGVYFPAEQRENIPLDVKAAIDLLASQKGIDSNRIGLLASTATNNYAVRAAMGDSRIKTMVGLSFYAPTPDVKEFLQRWEAPIFVIASLEDVNADGGSLAEGSQEVYEASNSDKSQIIMFDNAGRSVGMFNTKPELVGIIVRWFQEKLAK